VAVEVTSRFVLVMQLGPRTLESAVSMLAQVAGCCGPRLPLLLSDNHLPYPAAILRVFGRVLHRRRRRRRGRLKLKGLKPPPGLLAGVVLKVRDGSGRLLKVKTKALFGRLKDIRRKIKRFKLGNDINTAHVERFNGTARGRSARLARRTRDLSRRRTPLRAALGLLRDVYNFVHPHAALDGATPAMAVGLAEAPWSVRRYVTHPVHTADWQQMIWGEELENHTRSALNGPKPRQLVPT
jgi:hypothetical protein